MRGGQEEEEEPNEATRVYCCVFVTRDSKTKVRAERLPPTTTSTSTFVLGFFSRLFQFVFFRDAGHEKKHTRASDTNDPSTPVIPQE